MLKALFKKLVGDKVEGDLREIQPTVEAVHGFEAEFIQLQDSGLRSRTANLKKRISAHVASLEEESSALRAKASAMGEEDLEQKEAIYDSIDALEKSINEKLEEVLEEVMAEAFALVKETARRLSENKELRVEATDWDRDTAARRSGVTIEGDEAVWHNKWLAAGSEVEWNMVHYDVQLVGGTALHRGKVAEMQTGEGKTLVATLPVFLNALTEKGVHLVTVNDYLARRD